MSLVPPDVGRSEVNTSKARNKTRKKICEILRHNGNRERDTKLLRAVRAHEVLVGLRQESPWNRREEPWRLKSWKRRGRVSDAALKVDKRTPPRIDLAEKTAHGRSPCIRYDWRSGEHRTVIVITLSGFKDRSAL